MSKTDVKSSATASREDSGLDLFALSLEQSRKIQEMEKQVEFYKERCLDLKLSLNMQQVDSSDSSTVANQKLEQETKDLRGKHRHLETVVAGLQRELEVQQQHGKSLKMQIAQKDQQIETLEKQSKKQTDELASYQDKLTALTRVSDQRLMDKARIEGQLTNEKKENEKLKQRVVDVEQAARREADKAAQALEEAEKAAKKQTPEEYLEEAAEEMDLQQMQQYVQMVTFKFMKMQAEYNFEQTKKGGANAQNIQWPQLAAMAGMQANMQNGNQFGAGMMGAPMGMPGAGFQMPNLGGMSGLSPHMMNPAMFAAPQSPQSAAQFNGMAGQQFTASDFQATRQ